MSIIYISARLSLVNEPAAGDALDCMWTSYKVCVRSCMALRRSSVQSLFILIFNK